MIRERGISLTDPHSCEKFQVSFTFPSPQRPLLTLHPPPISKRWAGQQGLLSDGDGQAHPLCVKRKEPTLAGFLLFQSHDGDLPETQRLWLHPSRADMMLITTDLSVG